MFNDKPQYNIYNDAKQSAEKTANEIKKSAQDFSDDMKNSAQKKVDNAKETVKNNVYNEENLTFEEKLAHKHSKGPIGSTISAAEKAATKAASIAVEGVAAAEEAAEKVSEVAKNAAKKMSHSAKGTAENMSKKLKKFSIYQADIPRQNIVYFNTSLARFNRRLVVPIGTSVIGANILLRYLTNY